MYAIVKTGGKQYKVTEGLNILVEKLDGDAEGTIELTTVLAIGEEGSLTVGSPTVEGAKVIATIMEQTKGVKINGFTYKPKKSIRKRYGHRQQLTRLHIDSIVA